MLLTCSPWFCFEDYFMTVASLVFPNITNVPIVVLSSVLFFVEKHWVIRLNVITTLYQQIIYVESAASTKQAGWMCDKHLIFRIGSGHLVHCGSTKVAFKCQVELGGLVTEREDCSATHGDREFSWESDLQAFTLKPYEWVRKFKETACISGLMHNRCSVRKSNERQIQANQAIFFSQPVLSQRRQLHTW